MDVLKKVLELEKEADEFGFQWNTHDQLFEQIESECKEVKAELDQSANRQKLQEEIGDLIHATLSLCVFCGFDPKETLELSTRKLEKRLNEVMTKAKEKGFQDLKGQPFDVLMEFWNEAKKSVG